MTSPDPMPLDDAERALLRARLEASRAALLAALEGVTSAISGPTWADGVTVCAAARGAVAEEQADVARSGADGHGGPAGAPAAPQVVPAWPAPATDPARLDGAGLAPDAARAMVAGIERASRRRRSASAPAAGDRRWSSR